VDCNSNCSCAVSSEADAAVAASVQHDDTVSSVVSIAAAVVVVVESSAAAAVTTLLGTFLLLFFSRFFSSLGTCFVCLFVRIIVSTCWVAPVFLNVFLPAKYKYVVLILWWDPKRTGE